MTDPQPGTPTLLQEDEEVIGDPSFELLVRDGVPIVSGSYFIHPPLRAVSADWDATTNDRLLVTADDGTHWAADNVSRTGTANAVLYPTEGSHPAYASKDAPPNAD
jgi:hypothetical protein